MADAVRRPGKTAWEENQEKNGVLPCPKGCHKRLPKFKKREAHKQTTGKKRGDDPGRKSCIPWEGGKTALHKKKLGRKETLQASVCMKKGLVVVSLPGSKGPGCFLEERGGENENFPFPIEKKRGLHFSPSATWEGKKGWGLAPGHCRKAFWGGPQA